MATDQKTPVYPGDIIQDSAGFLYLVMQTHGWGIGAVMRWADNVGRPREVYKRFKDGEFVVVGTAHLLPPDVAAARRDAVAHALGITSEEK